MGGAGGCGTFKTREDPSCPRRNQEGSREHHTGLWLYCTVTVGAVTPPPERGSEEGRASEGRARRGPQRRAAEEPSPNSGPRPRAPRPGPAPARPREVSQRTARPPAWGAGWGRAGVSAPTFALARRGDPGSQGRSASFRGGGGWQLPGGWRRPGSRARGGGAAREGVLGAKCIGLCAGRPPPTPLVHGFFGAPRSARRGGGEAGLH